MAPRRNFPLNVSPSLMGCCALAAEISAAKPAAKPRPANRIAAITIPSMRGHNAPLGHDSLAHLPGILGAGDFLDLDRDFLADEVFQLRGLGVAGGDELKGFRAGFQ